MNRSSLRSALPWMAGPWRDALFLLTPLVFCTVVLLSYHLVPEGGAPATVLAETLFFVTTFHTLFSVRLYRDKILPLGAKQFSFAAFVLPVCFFISLSEWYLGRHAMLTIASPSIGLLYILNAWHDTAQGKFIVNAYRARIGGDTPADHLPDSFLIVVNAVLFYGIGWFYLDQVTFLNVFRIRAIPYAFVVLLMALFVAMIIVWRRKAVLLRSDRAQLLPTWALISALVVPWPMFLVLWKPEPSLKLITVTSIAHAIQYLGIHFFFFPFKRRRYWSAIMTAATGTVIVMLLMRITGYYYGKHPVYSHSLQGLLIGITVLHVAADFGLFRRYDQIVPLNVK